MICFTLTISVKFFKEKKCDFFFQRPCPMTRKSIMLYFQQWFHFNLYLTIFLFYLCDLFIDLVTFLLQAISLRQSLSVHRWSVYDLLISTFVLHHLLHSKLGVNILYIMCKHFYYIMYACFNLYENWNSDEVMIIDVQIYF